MKKSAIFGLAAFAAIGAGAVPASRVLAQTFDEFSPDKIAALRAEGPKGLEKLVAAHADELKINTPNPPRDDASWKRLCAALDEVGGQKDDYAARLYWFTDLEAAKAASKLQNKPILSLRLLGKLTDELSCANSRFFRTALYPNAQISAELRDKFILHWSSERPVPVVTIDFGDGRQIKRTLTGNSAHYLLDFEGKPLDVLPGLYGPGAFQKWLESGEKLFADYEDKPEVERGAFLADWHRKAIEELWENYARVAPRSVTPAFIKASIHDTFRFNPLTAAERTEFPSANSIAGAYISKSLPEIPLLDATRVFGAAPSSRLEIGSIWNPDPWSPLDAAYANDAKMDAASRNFLRAQHPIFMAQESNPVLSGPQLQEAALTFRPVAPKVEPLEQVIADFENAMARDTARNTIRFHAPIHALFAQKGQGDFEELNRKIYDKLFLTPKADRWLGLNTPGIYTGIQNGGLLEAPHSN